MATEYIRRRDSDGVDHYVDKQNEPMSCALASLGMAWQLYRQSCMVAASEERLKLTSSMFPGSLLASQLAGENNGQGNGTWNTNLTQSLNAVGMIVTQTDNYLPHTNAYAFAWRKHLIRENKPAILLVGWYTQTAAGFQRNGGHFIIAPRVTRNGWVVVLDPASGTLHELHGSRGHYNNHGLHGYIDQIWYTG